METITSNFSLTVKRDTEANWNTLTSYIPEKGEVICYNPDNTTNYARFKVGDGTTLLQNLPFIFNLVDDVQTYIDEQILGGKW